MLISFQPVTVKSYHTNNYTALLKSILALLHLLFSDKIFFFLMNEAHLQSKQEISILPRQAATFLVFKAW